MVPTDAPEHVAEDRPDPIDLRDFPWMPLYVGRIRDSTLAIESTGDEFKAWILLLCASWHQVPAGTLPDSDRQLAHLAGMTGDLERWASVKEMALHGWAPADAGRLSHPLIAELAADAWERERTRAARRDRDNKRKRDSRRHGPSEVRETSPGYPAPRPPDIRRTSSGRPQDFQGTSAGNPRRTMTMTRELEAGAVDNVDNSSSAVPERPGRANVSLQQLVVDPRFHLQFDGARSSDYDRSREEEAGLRLVDKAGKQERPGEWMTAYLDIAKRLWDEQREPWRGKPYRLSVICRRPFSEYVAEEMRKLELAEGAALTSRR